MKLSFVALILVAVVYGVVVGNDTNKQPIKLESVHRQAPTIVTNPPASSIPLWFTNAEAAYMQGAMTGARILRANPQMKDHMVGETAHDYWVLATESFAPKKP